MATESNPVGIEQVLQSLEEMKTAMAALKRSCSEDREATEERVAKRIRLDPPPTFKKKGHGKQFVFNSTLEDKLDDCKASLDEIPPSIEKAKAALEEGKKLIRERQKLIKIADRSEYGWSTVEEYVEDALADDSEDEKRLFRAESRAKRRHKAGEDKRRKPIRKVPESKSSSISSRLGPPVTSKAPPSMASIAPGVSAPPVGPCFSCGKMGHLRRFCPLLVKP